ncbi:MAG: acetylxylan esterase [Tannerellaceae bacterium]|nr:acetylxylan esterase [Tannerellaceae bacterium]
MKNAVTGIFLLILFAAHAQQRNVLYDEEKVPVYALPPLLVGEHGEKITTAGEWEEIRRPELLQMFALQMFGETPEGDVEARYETVKTNTRALGGKATSKQIKAIFSRGSVERHMRILIYLPNQIDGKAPLFVGYNFNGNQTVNDDPDIIPSSEAERGSSRSRWPVETILSAGYGLATIWYYDLFPDEKDKHAESILPLFGYQSAGDITDSYWQAMGAWAWGLSRAMDYFETDCDIDASKVVLMGHSRNGKATLWAGAQDTRFAMVISNDSGCGGAALSKRTFGETIESITSAFPHWFCKYFRRYAGNEQNLPFDQHQFLALIAPRPLYIASAAEDLWADPKGEYLSGYHAGEVYRLYGMKGLETTDMPDINRPVMNRVGYHVRSGKHDVTDFDWKNYILFADKWLK